MNGRHVLLCAVLLLVACTWPAAAHTVIEAPSGTVAAGSNATLLLGIGDVTGIEGVAFTLTWDPGQFTVTAIAPADGAPALLTVSTIRNDEGWAKVVVTCPMGITVATDTCEPVLAVTVAAGDESGTAPVGFAMAVYSAGFLPFVFDEAAEGVITITAVDQPVPAPDAAFSATPVTGTAPLSVTFTDSTTDASTWSWDFGDGATATVQHPVHVYTAVGTYTVRLTVTGEGGSDTATRSGYIIVTEAADGPLDADFTAPVVSGPAPLEVSFRDASTGSPDRWGWVFGDGGTANVKNPVHVYTTPGTYTVSLLAGDGVTNSRETKLAYIVVTEAGPAAPAPDASFSATPVAGTAPLAVTFTDTSTDAATWSWDFGDGATSSDANPVHTYTAAGTYDVILTVTNTGGSDTMTREGYISAGLPAPVAGFSAVDTSGTIPLTVSFTDSSSGIDLAYSWDFGDGSTSSDVNPVHTYTAAGTYDVSLTVTGEGGSDTMTRDGYISAGLSAPIAGFSAVDTSGTIPLTVLFTDSSSGTDLTYAWDFGDGSTSSEANPVHTYTAAGIYDVILTVTNTGGSDTMTREGYISAGLPAPVAVFSAVDTSGTIPLTVSFTDSSTGTNLAYAWDFGDGSTSSDANPVHTYTAAGTYDVSLTVTNAGGSDTMTREGYISVSGELELPEVNFYLIGGTPVANKNILFLDISTDADGSIVSRLWDFGDGSTAANRVVSHKYVLAGDYDVSLTVIDSDGLSATKTKTIRVVEETSSTSYIRIS